MATSPAAAPSPASPRPNAPPPPPEPPRPFAVLDLGASAIRLVVAEVQPGAPLRDPRGGLARGAPGQGHLHPRPPGRGHRGGDAQGPRGLPHASWTPTGWCATARSPPRPCARPATARPSSTGCACAPASRSRSSTAPRRTASPTWRCARPCATTRPSPPATRSCSEVGGGSADLSFLRKGQPIHSGTYALGSIRMRQNLASWHGNHEQWVRLLRRHIHNVVEDIRREMPLREAKHFVALGGDVRFAAEQHRGRARAAGRRRASFPATPSWPSATRSRPTTSSRSSSASACPRPRPRPWCPRCS